MADTQKKMTIDEAVKILKSDSYINYSVDELLEAVRLVKNDVVTRPDLLEEFYKGYYNQTLDETGVNYREFDKLQGIFAGTEYAKELKQNAAELAQEDAYVLNKGEDQNLSFVEMDNIQALLAVVPQNNQVRSARSKLNNMILAKMDAVIESKETVGIFELEAAQRLAENISNKKKKALVQKKLTEVLQSYEEENGLNQDVEVLRRNDKSLGEHLDNVRLYTDGKVSDEFHDLAGIITNVEMTEDDDTVLDADKKQRQLDMLFEAAKLEAHQENIGNIRYLMAPKNAQRKQLVEKVQDLFVAKLAQAGIASAFAAPTVEEQQDENKFKAYMKRRAEAANAFIKRLKDGSQKLQLKVKDIITACADTDVEVTKFKDILEAKIGKGTSVLGKKLNIFRDKAAKLWGKAYEISRNVGKSIKEHKWQHIANITATTIVAATGYGAVAVGAYAAYSAAGAWVWPIIAEAQKQRNAAQQQGEKLGFGKAWKSAWNKLKEDRNYKNRAVWGTVGAGIGGLIGAGGMSMGLEKAGARVVSGLARSVSSLSAQTTALAWARKDFRKNPTEENRSKLKAAKYAFGISALVSAAGAYFSINRLGNANLDTVTGADRSLDQLGPVTGGPADWKDHMQMSTPLREGWGQLPAEDAAGGVPGAAGAEAVVPSAEDSFFPEQYEADMGITQAQYNNLLKLYSTEDLDRMYMNLSASGIMEHMDGMTKEEFIFKWSKLDAYTDRVRWDEKAQQYISIQGAKRYHFENEMTDLNKMLNCGDKLELAQVEKIKAALGTIDDRGGYHGPGYVPTENYHVKGAGVDGPCAEGQENHFNRGGAAKLPEEKAEARVEPKPEPKTLPLNLDMEYGESQYNIPEYRQQMTEGVGTVQKQVEGQVKWFVSGPHGQHPIPEDAKMTMNAKTGEVLVEYSKEDGRASEIYPKSALRKEVNMETKTYEEPVQVPVPYTPLSDQTVSEAAELGGCKPGELTKTSVFNGTSQYKMYTEDGVVRIRVDKDHVPHFSMENMDGSEATAVPTKIVEGRFKQADALLREGKYNSIPAQNEVGRQLLNRSRGGLSK